MRQPENTLYKCVRILSSLLSGGRRERGLPECFSMIYSRDSLPKFRSLICDPTVLWIFVCNQVAASITRPAQAPCVRQARLDSASRTIFRETDYDKTYHL